MIESEVIDSFNTRLTQDVSNLKRLTPGQRDLVKHYGSQAEALLKNRDLAMFVHHYRFELNDNLVGITSHSDLDNATRIAWTNYLSGVDGLVQSLRRAVLNRDRVLKFESESTTQRS